MKFVKQSSAMCPKCHRESVGQFVYGPASTLNVYKKEIAEGKIRAAGCIVCPDTHNYFCMDCDYEW